MQIEVDTTPQSPQPGSMLDVDLVEKVRHLTALKWSVRRIAGELGIARNTVRRYARGAVAGRQERLEARVLTPEEVKRAQDLCRVEAEGNGVVVRELLAGAQQPVRVSLRTLQRHLKPVRDEARAAEVATVRFETAPGQQMQIDFGERRVRIGSVLLTVYLFVAVLCFSRRLYVRASLSQRQDEWKQGIEGALRRFGGRPQVVVVDNARALILSHTEGEVRVHPAFKAFCDDRGIAVFACRAYRPRTKGKVESGVKYVKHNAIAGRSFASFEAVERHLESWMDQADQRVHGSTHRRPIDLFRELERGALRPLHDVRLQVAGQRLKRKVANDCFVDLDTVRYSVPYRLVGRTVEISAGSLDISIWHAGLEVARHRRGHEPHARICEPKHFEGLLRPHTEPTVVEAQEGAQGPLACFGRSLDDYLQALDPHRLERCSAEATPGSPALLGTPLGGEEENPKGSAKKRGAL